jgi:hypothetical protein
MLALTCCFALPITDVVLNFAHVGVEPKKHHLRLRPWDCRTLDLRRSCLIFWFDEGVNV